MVLSLGLVSRDATAATSGYCGGENLNASWSCYGKARSLYGTSGHGDQHSVCVWVADGGGGYTYEFPMCSGGPGQGVYNPLERTLTATPAIMNNGGSWNTVWGTAYQP
jgi:hypothetical protein